MFLEQIRNIRSVWIARTPKKTPDRSAAVDALVWSRGRTIAWKLPLVVSALLTLPAQPALADVQALREVYRSNLRLESEVDSLYLPIYRVPMTVHAGDLLRLAGFLEVSERGGKRNKVFAYLSVRPVGASARSRVSSEAAQVANANQNHHMALNLFGHYVVPSNGSYVIELMARKSAASVVAVEDRKACTNPLPDSETVQCPNPPFLESGRGQIIVEHYRTYGSVLAAAAAGARFLVASDRAPFNPTDVYACRDPRDSEANYEDFLRTASRSFDVAAGDIIRIQSATTGQMSGEGALFALDLRLGGDSNERFALASENLLYPLFRFTLQNDGVYAAKSPQRVYAYQRVSRGVDKPGTDAPDCPLIKAGGYTDLVVMHFAPAVAGGIIGAYLAESREEVATSHLTFDVGDPVQELLSLIGRHEAGDILRVQSQMQLAMISGETGAACRTRVEIYENGTRRYQSIYDQRFIRNSSDSADDHDAGAFGPFALYQTRQAGEHRVRLLADCDATGAATMQASSYGRHLTVDRFTW